jgi:hypothetical protein
MDYLMRSAADGYGYNERLFSGGIRGFLHTARYRFVQDVIRRHQMNASSVLELGCFDGKLIDYLPALPQSYWGFDANWEGGLDLANRKWGVRPGWSFCEATEPAHLAVLGSSMFPLTVAMETLEHIPPSILNGYIDALADHSCGHAIFTVPNEKGLVFLGKYLAKAALSKGARQYTPAEVFNATLGRVDKVVRDQHKGFDYAALIRQVERRFDILEVTGHPFSALPAALCFGVGIVARARR